MNKIHTQLHRFHTQFKKECGAVPIIEATFLFPVVLVVLAFLLYIAFYIMQGVLIYNYTQQAAVAASREVSLPGYEVLYDVTGGLQTSADFAAAPEDAGSVNGVMEVHEPYRYWNPGVLSQSKKNTVGNDLQSLLGATSLLTGNSPDCKIGAKNHVLTQKITVQVEKKVDAMPVLEMIGVTGALDMNISTTAVVSDPAEFIRNTDMIFDLANYVFNDLKIGDSNQSIGARIGAFTDRIKHAVGITGK